MKYSLVTGATSGIGLAIAKQLLLEGDYVYLNHAHDTADRVQKELAVFAGKFEFIKADMSEYGGVDAIISFLSMNNTVLDRLILNYGATDRTSFGQVDITEWERVLRTNVTIPFFCIQSMLNKCILRAGGGGGGEYCTRRVGIGKHSSCIFRQLRRIQGRFERVESKLS